jgi:hypothetical protein
MIVRSILVFLLLMLTYESAIRLLQPSLESRFTQWQNNVTRAQKIVYAEDIIEKTWIAGTSLSNRLDMNMLTGIRNFSFGGLSLFEAFKIMKELDVHPDTILVEINVIDRLESKEFQDAILQPILFKTRKHLHGMRQNAQPIGLAVRYSYWLVNKLFVNKEVGKLIVSNQINSCTLSWKLNNNSPEKDRLNKAIESKHAEYSEKVDVEHLDNQLLKLKLDIVAFEALGIKIIFFEIPVHHSLLSLQKPSQIRNAFRTTFPESEYTYLPTDRRPYQTTDGVHLSEVEGRQYSIYLTSELKRNH